MTAALEIITIDGPSGSGKSTISRALAAHFGYAYLDTGAMYRAVGLQAKRTNTDVEDERQLLRLLDTIEITLLPGEGDATVLLNNEDVSHAIRTPEMSMMASKVSALQPVRKKLTQLQQKMAEKGKIVAEGRDMGTVVFPQAAYKFYLDATPEERARRRTEQLREKGMPADYEEILAQTKLRDHNDASRALAPLKAAEDATHVDSSRMSIDEVTTYIIAIIEDVQHH